ncbi:MAG TPA: GNAT family N-acetyltransferase [Arthrobacter sp.]|nr:GNAT family N-acetyltransferase [Arthrobacter sp.]
MNDDGGQPYRIDSFPATMEGEAADPRTAKWFEAVFFGFHDGRPVQEDLPKIIESYSRDQRVLTGAYVSEAPEAAWDPAIPVATYGTMVNTLNVGAGRLLPTHLVTAVTVRPTHRRKGLLRRMITRDLDTARRQGLAMAALTASEATIYGRFGFGAATFTNEVEIDTKERFAVRNAGRGTVEVADPAVLLDIGPQVFDQFHQNTTGSIGRQDAYRHRVAGQWNEEKLEPDKSVRAALHYDDGGRIDGYVSYKFTGWDKTPPTIKVRDLVTASNEAYLALWNYLGSIDLVERIKFPFAAVDDPLPWALSDRRGYSITGQEDVLWLRILDPVKALQARTYSTDGGIIIDLRDPLGWTEGKYRMQVSGQEAAVRLCGEQENTTADITVSVNALSSLYLGGVRATALVAAGELQCADPAVLELVDNMFAAPSAPWCITHF